MFSSVPHQLIFCETDNHPTKRAFLQMDIHDAVTIRVALGTRRGYVVREAHAVAVKFERGDVGGFGNRTETARTHRRAGAERAIARSCTASGAGLAATAVQRAAPAASAIANASISGRGGKGAGEFPVDVVVLPQHP